MSGKHGSESVTYYAERSKGYAVDGIPFTWSIYLLFGFLPLVKEQSQNDAEYNSQSVRNYV